MLVSLSSPLPTSLPATARRSSFSTRAYSATLRRSSELRSKVNSKKPLRLRSTCPRRLRQLSSASSCGYIPDHPFCMTKVSRIRPGRSSFGSISSPTDTVYRICRTPSSTILQSNSKPCQRYLWPSFISSTTTLPPRRHFDGT